MPEIKKELKQSDVKKITIPCNFRNGKMPVTLFIGDSAVGSHPFAFQGKWLSETRGGTIPDDIMKSFAELKKIADENNVSFPNLCQYVIDEINAGQKIAAEKKQASAPLISPNQNLKNDKK